MPRCKPLKSLLETCLTNICRNVDELWSKHYLETYGKENRFFRYVVGPFDALPSKLLCNILEILKKENRLRRHHLELLITIQLRMLDLSRESEDVRHPLQLAAIRCPDLRILNLEGCEKISKQVYQDFLPLFTQVQVLNLSYTKSGDSCMFIVGAYCNNLRELDITNCPVTDEGIRGLCVSIDDLGQTSDRLGQCKLIAKLIVNFTKVTEQGIQMALENLPHLKVFDCCSSVQVLSSMHRLAVEHQIPNIPKYSLIDLHCTESFVPYQRGDLNIAVALCTFIIKVRIVTQENMTNEDLMVLSSVNGLQELSVGAGEVCRISFNDGIFPLLQAHGQSLKSLTLTELPLVNVRAIAECCPNLRLLHLLMNRSYDSFWPKAERRPLFPEPVEVMAELKQLESLHLVCATRLDDPLSRIPAVHFSCLLSSPALSHIYIKDCPLLTDDMWKRALEGHGFPRLIQLDLEQCHQLTETTINKLMNASNPLNVLKIWDCEQLTRKQAAGWALKAKKKKWQLSIDWR